MTIYSNNFASNHVQKLIVIWNKHKPHMIRTNKIILSILFLIAYNSSNYAQKNDNQSVIVDGKK